MSSSPDTDSVATPPRSGEATVEEGSIDAAYAEGTRLKRLPRTPQTQVLAGSVYSPLAAALAPAASLDHSGDLLAYNAWKRGHPVLRVYDFAKGKDSAVEDGAFSAAWQDGDLAYFVGLRRRVSDVATHRGHVVVRDQATGRMTRWTREVAPYVVVAWADDELLVYRRREATVDVLAFSRAGRMRILARDSYLVAVDPSGRRAFLSEVGRHSPRVSVIDVASGRTRASLDVTQRNPTTGRPVQYVSYSGSWQGDVVAAPIDNGAVVFRVGDEEIAVDQVIGFDPDVLPTGVTETLLSSDGGSFAASAEFIKNPNAAVNEIALVQCERHTLTCEVGPSGPYARPPRLIYNPSRPSS